MRKLTRLVAPFTLAALPALLGASASCSRSPEALRAEARARLAETGTLWKFAPDPSPAAKKQAAALSLTASDGTGLALASYDSRGIVEGPLAFTELRLAFDNPEDRTLEGTFRITLPQGAAISRFAMKQGDRWQEGEVVEKQAARQAYEDFLHRRQDPALLEQAAGNEFSARVFPIPPKGRKELVVSYSQELGPDAPYTVALAGLPVVEKLDAVVSRTGDDAPLLGQVHLEKAAPDRDLVVESSKLLPGDGLRAGELALLRVQPAAQVGPDPVGAAIVMVDTSASRALGFEAEVELLDKLVQKLDPATALVVAAFDQGIDVVHEGPASGWSNGGPMRLRERQALGASDLEGALAWARSKAKATKAKRVVLVTDGVPTRGATDPKALRDAAKELAGVGVERIDAVAVGGIRDDALLRRLTTAGLARDGIVVDGARGADVAFRRISAGTRAATVKVEGARWQWPEKVEGVQPGDEVLVYAEVPEGTAPRVRIGEGPLSEPKLAVVDRPLLERAWVGARIAELSARPPEKATEDAVKNEIVRLSTTYRVLSPHTALLVLETEADYARYKIDRRALADILTVDGTKLVRRKRSEDSPFAPPPVREDKPTVLPDDAVRPAPRPRPAEPANLAAEAPHAKPKRGPMRLAPGAPEAPEPPRPRAARRAEPGRSLYMDGDGLQAEASPPAPSSAPAAPPRAHLELAPPANEVAASASPPPPVAAAPPSPAAAATAAAAAPVATMDVPAREANAEPAPSRPAAPAAANPFGGDVGDAPGSGGLGLSGIGEGGGGRGEGIGLGNIGSLGHGAGTGTGQGFGSGHGRLGGSHRAKPPVVQMGTPQVSQRLPTAVIQRIVRQNFGRFRLCYESGLRLNPNLSGRVTVRFVIGADGQVTNATNGGSDMPDPAVVACVTRAFRGLSFPQPEGGPETVVYPIVFAPGDGVAPSPTPPSPDTPSPEAARRPPPPPPKPRFGPYEGVMAEVMDALAKGDKDGALAKAVAAWRAGPGDVMALVALGEAFEARGEVRSAARAYGSIIDVFSARADLRRMAGERLERLAPAYAHDLAADSYAKAVQERPDHPAGHRLLAYARLRAGDPAGAFDAVEAGARRVYPAGRFAGVDRILREDMGLVAAAWLKVEPSKREEVERRLAAASASLATAPSVRFVLVWETDNNDVDFHIHDGRGGHAYYSQRNLPSGGSLYADVTTGYGPECFTVPLPPEERAAPYKLQAHYYSRGPMGYGMGKLEIVDHDGRGGMTFEERPFVVMADRAFVELGTYPAREK